MAQDLIRCFPSMERFERGLTTSQRVVWDGLFYEEKKVLYEGILDAIKEHEARVIRDSFESANLTTGEFNEP